MILGIIVDTFSQLRHEKENIEEAMASECFICRLQFIYAGMQLTAPIASGAMILIDSGLGSRSTSSTSTTCGTICFTWCTSAPSQQRYWPLTSNMLLKSLPWKRKLRFSQLTNHWLCSLKRKQRYDGWCSFKSLLLTLHAIQDNHMETMLTEVLDLLRKQEQRQVEATRRQQEQNWTTQVRAATLIEGKWGWPAVMCLL